MNDEMNIDPEKMRVEMDFISKQVRAATKDIESIYKKKTSGLELTMEEEKQFYDFAVWMKSQDAKSKELLRNFKIGCGKNPEMSSIEDRATTLSKIQPDKFTYEEALKFHEDVNKRAADGVKLLDDIISEYETKYKNEDNK